jgi:ubiquinone/menaquinone biosynthesis C-methylase UbiE
MNPTYKGSIELLRDFWERRSASFEKDYGIRQKGIVKLANETAKLIDGRLVLELGCGPGIIARFYPRNAEVVGLDFSSLMLKRAKKRIQKLVLGDTLSLPFRSETFEVVTCFFMASDYAAKENIFSEAFRALETGGVFLYADYSPDDEHWRLRREIRPTLGESCDIHIEGSKELSEKLKHVGLIVHEAKLIRFSAEFRLERYVKSRNEIQRLKEISSNLWKRLKVCAESGRIEREFILLISRK